MKDKARPIPKILLIPGLSISLIILWYFVSINMNASFAPVISSHSVCIFLSLILVITFMERDLYDDFYKKTLMFIFLVQAIFINPRLGPFAVECLYTLWLLSNWDKPNTYLRVFNFALSISMMALLFLDHSLFKIKDLMEDIILFVSLLRCAYVNYTHVNNTYPRGLEDVMFSTLSLFLLSRAIEINHWAILIVFVTFFSVLGIMNRSKQEFRAMLTWQFFIGATSGIVQGLSLSLLLTALRPTMASETKNDKVNRSSVLFFAIILMFFLIRGFSQKMFILDIIGLLALQWILWNVFFVRLLKREYIHITLLVFIIYLFYERS